VPESLEALLQRRTQIVSQIVALGDLRAGSITSTTGRCGKKNCRCHQPNQPPHGPNPRLTFKVKGKTVTESLPHPAAIKKVQREIDEFRKFEQLTREFVDINAQICHLRPGTESVETPQEKKRRKPSKKKSPGK
jgi:hypothetical protein